MPALPPSVQASDRKGFNVTMNETAFLAFVVAPAAVVLLGYVAVRLQEWETARVRRLIAGQAHQPAE